MFRHASIRIALLFILACDIDAKYSDYGRILENPEFEQVLRLFAPEMMLTIDENTREAYTLNSRCRSDLIDLRNALASNEKWALTMLDASSNPPSSGLLRGNLIDLGQQDECLADSPGTRIRGHFCTYSFSVKRENVMLFVNPTMSICLPETCSDVDVFEFFRVLTFSTFEKLKDLEIKIIPARCPPMEQSVWDSEFVLCLIILIGFIIFLIICTIMDVRLKLLHDGHGRDALVYTLSRFSLKKSVASVLSLEVKKGTLPAIDGIRCISAVFVVFYHVGFYYHLAATANTLDFIEWRQNWRSSSVNVAPLAVNTFLSLSGLLTTFSFLKKMSGQQNFNVPMYYFHRYLRLTPAVLALMVLTIVFVPKLGSGSHWDEQLSFHITSCRTKWWPALLYLQNYVDKENLCLSHLWYLAVDMHFFLISPLILYALYKKPKYSLMFLTALLISIWIVQASIIGITKIPVMSPYHEYNETFRDADFRDVYTNTFYRLGPWLIGVFFGYELAMHDRQLNRLFAAIGWLTAIAAFAFIEFGQISFMGPDYEYNAVWESLYYTAKEPIWSFGVCWIIYASIKNQAGFISGFLSSRICLPFSRLSYCIYLVHYVIIMINYAGLKTPMYFSESYLWSFFITIFVISTAVAFLFSILFETPMIVLEDILRRKRKPQNKITQTN